MKYFILATAMLASLSCNAGDLEESINDKAFTALMAKVEFPEISRVNPRKTLADIGRMCVRPLNEKSVLAAQANIDGTADAINRELKKRVLHDKVARLSNSDVCAVVVGKL